MSPGPPWARSQELYARATRLMPGGVNSPVRAMGSIGRDPIFVAEGSGAELVDVDGNRHIDWMCSWGPLIAGHAHPAVIVPWNDRLAVIPRHDHRGGGLGLRDAR